MVDIRKKPKRCVGVLFIGWHKASTARGARGWKVEEFRGTCQEFECELLIIATRIGAAHHDIES